MGVGYGDTIGSTALSQAGSGSVREDAIAVIHALGTLELASTILGVMILLGVLVYGLVPRYGREAVRTTQESPVISVAIGLPIAIVLGSLLYTSVLIVDTSMGVFFAVPFAAVSLTLLPAWVAVGFVGIGGLFCRSVGVDRVWVWILFGSTASALASLIPAIWFAITFASAILGCGAGVRTLYGGSTGTTDREGRVIPPANKI